MGFASAYLENRAIFPRLIEEADDNHTGIIVVVPAFNEPGIERLLDSLKLCIEPSCKVEVIVVVNAPPDADLLSIENNKLTVQKIESWKSKNRNCFFPLFSFFADSLGMNRWGVGLARKTGMDEAVRRFNDIDMPGGVILNLDADCTVREDYFVAICNELFRKKERSACSIYFEHPLSGTEFPPAIYNSVALYELHLRYYIQSLSYTGFPYAYHTVGSSMAVKALQYVRVGGMNRKQAGEDFYFIQKLSNDSGYFSLNATTVYPSPRLSLRVPFGTGATMSKMAGNEKEELLTYNFQAFEELRNFFGLTDTYYNSGSDSLSAHFNALPESLKHFFNRDEWIAKLTEIKSNTNNVSSFRKRFFNWFNMFSIVKHLNSIHIQLFKKQPVGEMAAGLLQKLGIETNSKDPVMLLLKYRELEK